MKGQNSVRKKLGLLISWVNFANGKESPAPHLAETIDENMRETARGILHAAAEYQRGLAKSPKAPSPIAIRLRLPAPRIFDPAPPPKDEVYFRFVIDPTHIGPYDYKDWLRDGLFPALSQNIGPEQAWHRLRICPCRDVFVALTLRAQYCTPACSNRLRQKQFYDKNPAAERQRKLRRYYANRTRNRTTREWHKRRATRTNQDLFLR